MKIRPVRGKFFYADEAVAFCNFVNVPKKLRNGEM
jgi:hypothetical protein